MGSSYNKHVIWADAAQIILQKDWTMHLRWQKLCIANLLTSHRLDPSQTSLVEATDSQLKRTVPNLYALLVVCNTN